MRFDPPLRIAAVEVWLPPTRETVAEAVLAGRVESARAATNGYLEVRTSDVPPPQMAVRAADAALTRSGLARDDVGLLAHAWSYYQGQDYWEPVHYIINELKLSRAVPLSLGLGCNGGMAGLEVAASRLIADPDVGSVVVTTAERFALPRFDRWHANLDVAYGDSATALVLDRRVGGLEVLSATSTAATEFEVMYRGEWGTHPFEHEPAVDIRSKLRRFLATGEGPRFAEIAADALRRTAGRALEQAGLDPADPRIRVVAPPRFGAELIERSYAEVMAGFVKADVVNLGRRTGHLGAGDMAANLHDLTRSGTLAAGDVALLLSATAGFTWSALVVRAV